jgi:hypothetical protein
MIKIYYNPNIMQIAKWDWMDLENELLIQYVCLHMAYDNMNLVITYLHNIHFYYSDKIILKFICKCDYYLISFFFVTFKFSRNTDKRFG